MNRLEVPLTQYQEELLLGFFYTYPSFLNSEHYRHTHSPLDNLKHYIWEEMYEPYHLNIRQNYEQTGYLTNEDINNWMNQERQEKGII